MFHFWNKNLKTGCKLEHGFLRDVKYLNVDQSSCVQSSSTKYQHHVNNATHNEEL